MENKNEPSTPTGVVRIVSITVHGFYREEQDPPDKLTWGIVSLESKPIPFGETIVVTKLSNENSIG